MATRSGSAFQLADSITAGTLCVVCTADSQLAALNALGVALHFLKVRPITRADLSSQSDTRTMSRPRLGSETMKRGSPI